MFDAGTFLPYVWVIIIHVLLPFLVAGDTPTGAVVLIQWIKEKLNLSGPIVGVVVIAVSAAIGAILAGIDGLFDIVELTPERFGAIVVALIAATQFWYNRIKDEIN